MNAKRIIEDGIVLAFGGAAVIVMAIAIAGLACGLIDWDFGKTSYSDAAIQKIYENGYEKGVRETTHLFRMEIEK